MNGTNGWLHPISWVRWFRNILRNQLKYCNWVAAHLTFHKRWWHLIISLLLVLIFRRSLLKINTSKPKMEWLIRYMIWCSHYLSKRVALMRFCRKIRWTVCFAMKIFQQEWWELWSNVIEYWLKGVWWYRFHMVREKLDNFFIAIAFHLSLCK